MKFPRIMIFFILGLVPDDDAKEGFLLTPQEWDDFRYRWRITHWRKITPPKP